MGRHGIIRWHPTTGGHDRFVPGSAISICLFSSSSVGGPILKLALFALFTFAGFQSGTIDPRAGSWALVFAQSSLTPPDTLVITDDHGTVHVAMNGETHLDFTAKAGDHDTAVPANPVFDQVALKRNNKKQAEVTEKKGGAVVATVRLKLAKDGNELTITTTSTGHPDQSTVWTRTGGAKAPFDAMAGNWTEDMSKTRLSQGLTVKIEPAANGGVHFASDFSYTARFDGKPADLTNSRNDTVTLQLVDSHTVDATYRRDNQVTQKDRWTVSPDGQQMTVFRTATYETGQHLAEKLVFKKL